MKAPGEGGFYPPPSPSTFLGGGAPLLSLGSFTCSAWAFPTLRLEELTLRELCQRRRHGHSPRAEQAVGARQDRVQGYV